MIQNERPEDVVIINNQEKQDSPENIEEELSHLIEEEEINIKNDERRKESKRNWTINDKLNNKKEFPNEEAKEEVLHKDLGSKANKEESSEKTGSIMLQLDSVERINN